MNFDNGDVRKAIDRYVKMCVIPGLDRAVEIIENEQESSKELNPQIVMGMEQVRRLIEAEKLKVLNNLDKMERIDILE